MSAIVTPATEKHEDELARLNDEVRSLRRELRRDQRLATVGTMTAMVAHEFNNILTPIISYAQMARKNPRMVEKAITRASEGGLRATEICKAILGMTSDGPARPTEEQLAPLITEILAVMGREPAQDGIDLVIDIPRNFTVTTCRLEMQQVLLNLVINARTAVLAGSGPRRIEISVTRDAGNITLRVSDSGVGVAPELIDRIFDPFFTTNGHDGADSKGHGLGLAICKEIINSMGGDITVASTPGQGATFTIRLPDQPAGV